MCPIVGAQSASVSGAIRGTIIDPSGAVLPRVTVTAVDPQTGLHRTAVSDANGQFRLIGLSPAVYEVTAELPGFSTETRKSLAVAIGQNVVSDFQLRVSAVPVVVEVTDQPLAEPQEELLVRQRLRTDSPILADLSGGLDSSAVVCMADQILASDGIESLPLDTFTALVRDEPGEEDSKYFTAVERKRGRTGHRAEIVGLEAGNFFEHAHFTATPVLIGRPELDSAKLDIITHGKYRVLLVGTGGDEMLGQDVNPRVVLADRLRDLQMSTFLTQLGIWSHLLRRPWIHLVFDAILLQLPVWIRIRVDGLATIDPWVDSQFARKQRLAARQLEAAQGPLSWHPGTRDWFQTVMTLSGQMAANHPSLQETRYPFLDQRLVEFLISIPAEQLLRPGQRRSLMRRALADLLPEEILRRRTKSSAGRYFGASLEKHWHTLESTLRAPVIARCGIVDQSQFLVALRQAKNGEFSTSSLRLFKALFLELWLRKAFSAGVITTSPKTGHSASSDHIPGVATRYGHEPARTHWC